jgi:Tfp pilus assembly protein FimT
MAEFGAVRSQVRQERYAKQGGFSIAELIVGLQVSLILVLIALPTISLFLRGYRLRGAAREIFAGLATARMGAVMENHHYRFLVVDTHTYQLHDDTNSNDVVDAGETVMTRNIQVDSPGVEIASGSSNITFTANGTAPTYGTITVSSENVATESARVQVSAGGRIRIR